MRKKVESMLQLHPEINEIIGIPQFTHWLLLPETTEYYAFLKAVTLDRHSDKQRMIDRGILIYSYSSRPQGYPTKPIYKINNQ